VQLDQLQRPGLRLFDAARDGSAYSIKISAADGELTEVRNADSERERQARDREMQLFPSAPAMNCPREWWPAVVKTPDGVRLRYAVSPGLPGGRGTVCILPGRADFIERYFETIRDLQARGYAVAILDWRGQGGSDRLRWRPVSRASAASATTISISPPS
jgi:hypothetical protein